MKLHEMLRARKALQDEFRKLVDAESKLAAGEQMSEDDLKRLDAIKAEVKSLDGRIERAKEAADIEAAEARSAGNGEGEADESRNDLLTPTGYGEKMNSEDLDEKKGKGFKMARFAMGVLTAKAGGQGFAGAAQWVERKFGDKAVAKALNTAGNATGGALIPQDFYREIIELLRADCVIRQAAPLMMPMPLGNMTIPRLAAGATAGFQGELDDMTSSQESFDDLQLNAKKLTALVPVSNDLLRRAPFGVEALVRDDMVQTIARREDLSNLLGDGSSGSTIGLLNLCSANSKFAVPAFTAQDNQTLLTAVNNALAAMILSLKQNMSRMIRPVWIFSNATEMFLKMLRDQVGGFVYRDEMNGGKLLGLRYLTTQQLPTNINTAAAGNTAVNNGSYIFLADFADVIFAETYNVSVDASDVASYKDGGGNQVSTFTRDQTAFRVIEEFDFNIRHQASVAVAVVPGWYPTGFTPIGGMAYYVQAPSGDSSAAPSTFGSAAPTGSNNPANVAANVPGGTQPGRP